MSRMAPGTRLSAQSGQAHQIRRAISTTADAPPNTVPSTSRSRISVSRSSSRMPSVSQAPGDCSGTRSNPPASQRRSKPPGATEADRALAVVEDAAGESLVVRHRKCHGLRSCADQPASPSSFSALSLAFMNFSSVVVGHLRTLSYHPVVVSKNLCRSRRRSSA